MSDSTDIPEGYKATELGVLPEEWGIITLEEVAKINYGKAKPQDTGKIPVYGSGGVYGYVSNSLINQPTIIIGRKGTAGKVWLIKKPSWPSDTTFYLEWKENPPDCYFIFNYLNFAPLSTTLSKTTIPSLQKPDLEKKKIPLPPLPEQHAIATTLRTVQEAKENTDAVIEATKALKEAMMKHLFTYGPVPPEEADKVALKETEIGYMPEGWEILKLEDIVSVKITDGVHKTPKYTDTGVPFISAINMVNNTLNFLNCKCISFEAHEKLIQRCHPELNDILLCKVGATIGKVAKIEVTFPLSIFVQVALIKPDLLKINPDFLKYSLISKNGQSQILTNASQSTMPFIGTNKIGKILIPNPGIQIQEKIGKILFTIEQKLAAEQSRKEALDTLFASLLHNLMTAKIRVNSAEIG